MVWGEGGSVSGGRDQERERGARVESNIIKGLFYLQESVTDPDPTPKTRVLFTVLAQILRHFGESVSDPGDLPREVGYSQITPKLIKRPAILSSAEPLQLVYRVYRPRMTPLMS